MIELFEMMLLEVSPRDSGRAAAGLQRKELVKSALCFPRIAQVAVVLGTYISFFTSYERQI